MMTKTAPSNSNDPMSSGTSPDKKRVRFSKKDILKVTEHSPDIICRFDKSFVLLYVNPAIEHATGIPANSFINKTTRELGLPEDHSELWEEGIARVVTTGEQTTIEFPFLTPGGLRNYQSKLVPEPTSKGVVETVLSISRDITEMKKKDKWKEDVVGVVSHELKTPVTSLKTYTQSLQHKFTKMGDAKTAKHLAKMDSQIDKLTDIISDLLDATKFESGSMSLIKEHFDFDELVHETAEVVQNTTSLHRVVIKGTVGKEICADRLRIGQVITNILTNAVKYTPKPSDIIVSISADGEEITCSIRDFGVGIPKDKQDRIFERFYRVDRYESQKAHAGLGLGLYICAEIIRQHNGEIWVDSDAEEGTTVTFTLPYSTDSQDA